MGKSVRQLSGDLKTGRNLEQSLPDLMKRMASAYGMLSFYNLDMELSMFLESKAEGRIKTGRTIKELEETITRIIQETLLVPFSPEVYEASIKELIDIREKIIFRVFRTAGNCP